MKRWLIRQCEQELLRLYRSGVVAEFQGIRIASMQKDGAPFAKEISEALVFLMEHDLHRFRRVCKTTDFIVERTLPWGGNSGQYHHGVRSTSIDYQALDPGWDDAYRHGFFAGLIVHEATHGRIRDRGISTNRENRIQIERLCVAEEHRFYRRIGHLREGLAGQLSQPFDPSNWDIAWKSGLFAQIRLGVNRLRERSKTKSRRID